MDHDEPSGRSQVGVGTLAVFIAMVLVALLAGGVLLETTGLLQGKSGAAGEQSSHRVTDRVGVESATASYSSGSMQRIDIVLSKAPGSGDIDLTELTVHWLGPNGSTELTASTFSISPVTGSGTVLEARSDRMNVSNFGKTIPDGTPATVRFITPDGGTTTVILRTPNAPPSDGAVSLLWRSPTGNPASGGRTGTATATSTATATPTPTPTPTPEGSYSNVQWTYSGTQVDGIAVESGSSLYAFTNGNVGDPSHFEKIDPSDGSLLDRSPDDTGPYNHIAIDDQDRPVVVNMSTEDVKRWNTGSNTTTTIYDHGGDGNDVFDVGPYSGDLYLAKSSSGTGQIERRKTDGTVVWEFATTDLGAGDLDATGSYVYVDDGDYLEKYDHSGTNQWTQNMGDTLSALDADSSTYVHVANATDTIIQFKKSDGSQTRYSYQAYHSVYSMDLGPDGYLYIEDRKNLTVLDPADLSVVHRHEFDNFIDDVHARSDGVYLTKYNSLVKLEVGNLP